MILYLKIGYNGDAQQHEEKKYFMEHIASFTFFSWVAFLESVNWTSGGKNISGS